MSTLLQARGEGLPPVNTSCTSDSLAAFLEREGYTDVRVVAVKEKRTNDAAPTRDTSTKASRRRVVTRRPRT